VGDVFCICCRTLGSLVVSAEAPAVGVVVGKRLPPLQSHAIEWARGWVRVIAALHHTIDKVEKHSLDGIRHHERSRPHESRTNHHLISFLLLSFVS